jgi:hypothetical protein
MLGLPPTNRGGGHQHSEATEDWPQDGEQHLVRKALLVGADCCAARDTTCCAADSTCSTAWLAACRPVLIAVPMPDQRSPRTAPVAFATVSTCLSIACNAKRYVRPAILKMIECQACFCWRPLVTQSAYEPTIPANCKSAHTK